jgi:Putative Flp pilus-assembly TadE/G-like
MNARDSRGQAAVMTVLFLTVLIGASAMSLDVGSWFHAKRQLQAEADAAALAGAQALPDSPADAKAYAMQYSAKNGGHLDPSQITISSDVTANDTIKVQISAPAPGFFSKLFGLGSVTVGAGAAARSDNVAAALHVAPIVVNWQHPKLQCHPLPCPGMTEIDLADLHQPGSGNAAGAFGLIDLLQSDNGSVGASTLADWITQGFDEYMNPGLYNSAPSAKFNSVQVRDAMAASVGQVLLFPIYDSIVGPGSNAQYDIIGWVGFYVTGFVASGNTGKVYGYFTRRVSGGIQVSTGSNIPDNGVRAVQLVN